MAEVTYRDAVARAIRQEMARDERVVFFGEDVGAPGGVFKATVGLLDEFGPKRVLDTPISEQAILGAAMGAAMTGLRPIAEVMFSDFFAVCWDIVANEIAKARYMTNGQMTIPLVVRSANGGGVRFGAQHSQSVENWAMAVPGLKVVAPSTPRDVVGLFASAVRDDDPVLFFEQKSLYPVKGEIEDGEIIEPLGRARIARDGDDATVVALVAMVPRALDAADLLARGDRDCSDRSPITRPSRRFDRDRVGSQHGAPRHRGGEPPSVRMGRGARLDHRRRVSLRPRRARRARDDAACPLAGRGRSRRRGIAVSRAHRCRSEALAWVSA